MKSDGSFLCHCFKIQKHSTDDKSGISCHKFGREFNYNMGRLVLQYEGSCLDPTLY